MSNPFKGDLAFLDELEAVMQKHHGGNWSWAFGGQDSFEITLIIGGDIDDAE